MRAPAGPFTSAVKTSRPASTDTGIFSRRRPDGRPLATSRRMLVTHLTDVQADGNVYADREKRTLLKWGSYPPVVRNGRRARCARPPSDRP